MWIFNIKAQQFRRLVQKYDRLSECQIKTDAKEDLFLSGTDCGPIAFSHHYFLLRLIPRLRSKTRLYLWRLISERIKRLWLLLTIPYVRKIRRDEPQPDVVYMKDLVLAQDHTGLRVYLEICKAQGCFEKYDLWVKLAAVPGVNNFDLYLSEMLEGAHCSLKDEYLANPIESKILNDLALLFLR